MTITEQFICGKHTAADCEDGIVITPHFAAVIDGSTSKTPLRLDASMKNGRFAMLLICDYIRQMAADSTMDHFCQGITHRIAEEYAWRGIAERMAEHPEERLTASAIVYSERRKEVWMVGDCQAIIDGKYYDNSKPYEHEIAMPLLHSNTASIIMQYSLFCTLIALLLECKRGCIDKSRCQKRNINHKKRLSKTL